MAGFWQNRVTSKNEKRAERIERRGADRGERIAERADRSRADRIERAKSGWSGRPLRSRTWVR